MRAIRCTVAVGIDARSIGEYRQSVAFVRPLRKHGDDSIAHHTDVFNRQLGLCRRSPS